jgi:GT2 family glycosyltransferase
MSSQMAHHPAGETVAAIGQEFVKGPRPNHPPTKVSVLVHNLNRGESLRRCLSSIVLQSYRPLEVIILDAASTDTSSEVIRQTCRVLEKTGIQARAHICPAMGVAASRNLAASLATGDLLCFLDNDATLEGDSAVSAMVDRFGRDPLLALVSFRVLDGDGDGLDPFAWVFRRNSKTWGAREFRTFVFAGTGFCVRRAAFSEIGGFWDHLNYAREEEDAGFALVAGGWQIAYTPDITIRHYRDPRGRATLRQRRLTELRNGVLVLWRRLPMPLAMVAIPARVVTMSLRGFRSEGRRLWDLFSAVREAVQEWRAARLERAPVSFQASWRYFCLHLAR